MKPVLSQDEPYALQSRAERDRRFEMLTLPHMLPLTNYLQAIKEERGEGYDLPSFDPCDGGIFARALFLLEAPGRKAVSSTFISRNNPDQTAKNMVALLANANIKRSDTILWNIVPWYVGNRQKIREVNSLDLTESLPYLKQLIDLLPKLEVIVLIGKKSQQAYDTLRTLTDKPIVKTFHPSPRVFNMWPEKKKETQEMFHTVAQILAT